MLSVLIVDDNSDKITEIVKVLEQSDLVEYESIDSELAVENARTRMLNKQYDLLVLDLQLPLRLGQQPKGEHGYSLLQTVVQDDAFYLPRRIIGITEFTELTEQFKNDFASSGVFLVQYERTSDTWKEYIQILLKQLEYSKRADSVVGSIYDYDLGIVCALDVEFNAIQKLPWNFVEHHVTGDPTFYMTGRFSKGAFEHKVVAAFCPRMGMSNAAITATKLIGNFRPKILAMTGITGAIRGKVNLGDVIVAEECWDWGMGKWTKQNGKSIFEPGPHHLSLDTDLRAAAVRLSRQHMKLSEIREACEGTKPDTVLKIVVGPVASGSAVIGDQKMTDTIKAHHRKLIGIEMESYAVYNAASECSIPRPKAISIKAASDFADDQKDDQYRSYCCSASAKILCELVEHYVNF